MRDNFLTKIWNKIFHAAPRKRAAREDMDQRYGSKFSPLRKATREKKRARLAVQRSRRKNVVSAQLARRRRRRVGFKHNSFA